MTNPSFFIDTTEFGPMLSSDDGLVESTPVLTYSALIRCICTASRETICIAADLSRAQSFSGRLRVPGSAGAP